MQPDTDKKIERRKITYPVMKQKLTGIRCEVVIPYKVKKEKKQRYFK
jgi:hypothetical protein